MLLNIATVILMTLIVLTPTVVGFLVIRFRKNPNGLNRYRKPLQIAIPILMGITIVLMAIVFYEITQIQNNLMP
ncbi:hypothetical protein MZD04_gp082 [Pseudomonas phage Psa21]|uniref:Uncharacterized protein n=1 Tax=Pseudomonas phage Psa21 TaxID=2530023 RepID=A0A481W4Z0_9CAUD|nr:hypothetical protein MZD04_gp082 [Pseudomonas phage Psa21]QBJ02949.1 hypothetical protein PSA21_82 [Pseudomonas phage Psa21]